MAMAASTTEGDPMMDINTTPLIDVMLVLLIMFIITIPLQTHSVKLDLPQTPLTPPPSQPHPVMNEVFVDTQNRVLWNGSPVSLTILRQYLDATQAMNPIPELHVRPDPQARYELVDSVLAVTKRARVEKMGFVGNERYAGF
jgi:biopolymer transport protein ExbD